MASMRSSYILLSGILSLLVVAYGCLRRRFIDKIPGPPSSSWLTGNLPDIFRSPEIIDAPFKWIKQYGSVVKLHEEFGRKTLLISDPKAIHYVLNTPGYHFPKTPSARANQQLVIGKGLAWAEGAQHARQRKIMSTAFSFNVLREFIPIFFHKAQQAASKMKQQIELTRFTDSGATVVDVVPYISRVTLDVIGLASATYDFNAIEGGVQDKLARLRDRTDKITVDSVQRSDIDLIALYLMGKIPEFVFTLLKHLPIKDLKSLLQYVAAVSAVAQDVADKQTTLCSHGKEGSKNLMSVLVRANLSENSKTKLSNEEVVSQLTTFFAAGHVSVAFSLIWALYELSRHPEYQSKVRDQIRAVRAQAAQRSHGELTISDLDSMQYLSAAVKESLRFHPIFSDIIRQASRDDHIPLSHPVTLTTGEIIANLPVERGQNFRLSLSAYNRLKSVWGEDADVWRPERFLEERDDKKPINLGVTNNIATFGSGLKSCIGWRFAVLEIQAILIELLEKFEFSPPPGNVEILRVFVGVMAPTVKGSKSRYIELPLTVTPLSA